MGGRPIAFVAALAFLAISSFQASLGKAAPPVGSRHLEVGVIKLGPSDAILDLSGWSIEDSGPRYYVDVFLRRVPCGGRYLYVARGEDRRSDAETSFEAVLRLDEYESSPAGLPCGGPIPQRSGRRSARLSLANELATPFDLLTQRRRADNSFAATLTLNGITTCERPYWLVATLVNPRGSRQYRYRTTVLSAVTTLNGYVREVPSCPLLTHP
jgi:hypothetical protein